jgi:hypothetical protein
LRRWTASPPSPKHRFPTRNSAAPDNSCINRHARWNPDRRSRIHRLNRVRRSKDADVTTIDESRAKSGWACTASRRGAHSAA